MFGDVVSALAAGFWLGLKALAWLAGACAAGAAVIACIWLLAVVLAVAVGCWEVIEEYWQRRRGHAN